MPRSMWAEFVEADGHQASSVTRRQPGVAVAPGGVLQGELGESSVKVLKAHLLQSS
jgi:hypothetical protein